MCNVHTIFTANKSNYKKGKYQLEKCLVLNIAYTNSKVFYTNKFVLWNGAAGMNINVEYPYILTNLFNQPRESPTCFSFKIRQISHIVTFLKSDNKQYFKKEESCLVSK